MTPHSFSSVIRNTWKQFLQHFGSKLESDFLHSAGLHLNQSVKLCQSICLFSNIDDVSCNTETIMVKWYK